MTVFANYTEDEYGIIECVTGPQPSQAAYYPGEPPHTAWIHTPQDVVTTALLVAGGRGVLRELWVGSSNLDLNNLQNYPRAEENTIAHERMYVDSDNPDFGEGRARLGHRFSGFFVPPKSSLYTINILSDDQSRIIFYPNASTSLISTTSYTVNT